jgi:hypothetical protein
MKKFNLSNVKSSYFPKNKIGMSKTSYDNFYSSNKKYLTHQNMKKTNRNFNFKSNHSDKSFFSTSHNFRTRVSNYIDYLDYNNKKMKKVLSSKEKKKKLIFNKKKEDNIFYTSLSINKSKTENNKKAEEEKKNKKEINIELNPVLDSKIINKSNIGYFSENRKFNFDKTKTNLMFQTRKYIRNKASINDILYSMNDPSNPYSINFSTFILKKYYNLDFHFKKFELGVPLLRMRKFNLSNVKSSYFPKNKIGMSKTSYDNFYSSNKKYLTHQNMRKTNNFKSNHSDRNIYK